MTDVLLEVSACLTDTPVTCPMRPVLLPWCQRVLKPSSNPESRTSAALAVAMAGVLWGVNGVVSKSVFNSAIDPLTLLQARLFLSATILGACLVAFAPQRLRVKSQHLEPVVVWAFLGLVAVQAAYFWAVSLGGVAHAIFLQYTAPVFTALWARLVGKQHLGAALVGGIGLCLLGMSSLVLGGEGNVQLSGLALFAGLLSAVAGASNSVLGKRAVAHVDAPTALFLGLALGSVATCLVRNPMDTLQVMWPAHAGQILYIAVGATVLPFMLFLIGLHRLTPTDTILLAMLEPLVAAAGAWMFLGESLTATQIAGGVLVLVGVTVAELRAGTPDPAD